MNKIYDDNGILLYLITAAWKHVFSLRWHYGKNFILLYRGVNPSALLSKFRYLPISASFGVKRVIWYSLHNIPSYENLISTRQRLAKVKVWISFAPWIFFYILDFLINLQITTEWECTFLNIAIIIFCLIYSITIHHSNHNPSFYPAERSHFSDISPYCS